MKPRDAIPAIRARHLPRPPHWSAFRRAFGLSGLLALLMLLPTAVIYWQTVAYLRTQIDVHLLTDANALAAEPGPQTATRLARALAADPDHKRVGGVFDRDGRALSGNLPELPKPPPPLDAVTAIVVPIVASLPGRGALYVARLGLPGGGSLVFGRRVGELDQIGSIMWRALLVALAPLLFLAGAGGALLSHLTTRRIDAVEDACRDVAAGRLDARLPVRGGGNDVDLMSATVNRMLDELECLMLALKSSGEVIAHELRMPLSRLRARVDRLAHEDALDEGARDALGRLLTDVDDILSTMRAVLRLGEIEGGRRRAAFAPVSVVEVAQAVVELYGPVAEDKKVLLVADIRNAPLVVGDGDLLFEAIGNIVDNAVKFTPRDGEICLSVTAANSGCLVCVADTGPGMPADDGNAPLHRPRRRSSRGSEGNGLGLEIVAAIMRLHGGSMTIGGLPERTGCRVTLVCPAAPAPSEAP